MSNKIRILLVIIIAEIGLIGFSMNSKKEYNSLENNDLQQFALLDSAGVSTFIFGKNKLEKTPLGTWILNEKYTADIPLMRQLFLVLGKVEIKKPVSDQMKKDLVPQMKAQGIDIQFLKANTPHQSFQMLNRGGECYVMLPNQEMYVLYVPGYNISLSEVFSLTEGDWREKTIIATKFLSVRKVALTYPDKPNESFVIQKDSSFFRIDGVNKLDSNMVGNYVDAFKNVRVFSFLDKPAMKDSLQKVTPYCTIAIEGVLDEQSNTIKVYTDKKSLWGIVQKTNELVELEPRYFTRFLVRKKDFEK
jgi:ribosomal protein L30/L7E